MEDERIDDPAIRIEITPRDYRARATRFVVAGVVLLAVGIVLEVVFHYSHLNPGLYGVAFIGYGIVCAVRARRRVTREVLHIDREGIRSGDGLIDHSWSDVVTVWVGAPSGIRFRRVLTPNLYLYTGMGVHYARRAGTRPKALVTVQIGGGSMSVTRLCERLRKLARAQIVDGTVTSRRDAELALQRSS